MKNNVVQNITQEICDIYLQCPVCRVPSSLIIDDSGLSCKHCKCGYYMKDGIPALIPPGDIDPHSYRFLGKDGAIASPSIYKAVTPGIGHAIIAEIIYFFTALYFIKKYGMDAILRKRWCPEVNRALYFGWRNYFNLILKAGEIVAFNKMLRYIREPSLEIGCVDCRTTNMIFRDKLDSVTFGCEYWMDTYLDNKDEMFRLIKHFVGGSVKSLPFGPGKFNSVYMVHIIDHITDIDVWFREINRVLKVGGFLIISGYSKHTFDHLPGVNMRNLISRKWAKKYKLKRTTRQNPYRTGAPLSTNSSYDATGRNMLSLSEWQETAKRYQFEVADCRFFGKGFSYFTDLEYRGFTRSYLMNEFIYSAISRMIEDEKNNPLKEEESTNIVLVLEKKAEIE